MDGTSRNPRLRTPSPSGLANFVNFFLILVHASKLALFMLVECVKMHALLNALAWKGVAGINQLANNPVPELY